MQLKFKNHLCKSKVLKKRSYLQILRTNTCIIVSEKAFSLVLYKVNASKILLSPLCPQTVKLLEKYVMAENTEQIELFTYSLKVITISSA